MNITMIKEQLPEYAKDIKLNLSSVLKVEGELNEKQIACIASASAYSTKNKVLIGALEEEYGSILEDADINAAKASASIMAMNNVYYRFTHLVGDAEFMRMPAKLRMNVIANPGIDKVNFELMSLAVSAINGCGLCMESHTKVILKAGISRAAIQHAVRIASVINAAAQVLEII